MLYSRLCAQCFHFEDTSTTIIKNTTQSPAHWYLEIISDVMVDTNIRWKAHFENIPQEWNINFDAQNQNWPVVEDGDSSNFTLFYDADFPQKLIIGAVLNQTTGHGFVHFDIYDPHAPQYLQQIHYEYIVTVLGVSTLQELPFLKLEHNTLYFDQDIELEVYGTLGELIYSNKKVRELPLKSFKGSLLLQFNRENVNYCVKLLVQ